MGKAIHVDGINLRVLKQCREQFNLDLEEAAQRSKVQKLPEIERGDRIPTYLQLCRLAEIYLVPIWVFREEAIPQEFRFQETPAFRSLSRQNNNFSYKVRRLVQSVQDLRVLLLDLRSEEGNAIPPFVGPSSDHRVLSHEEIRTWLGVSGEQIHSGSDSFSLWRKAVEDKNIFVFMTRRYKHWSKMEVNMMRGLSLFHDTLPVIVVNDSDSHCAQTFTLMHELAHILRQKTILDAGDFNDLNSDNEEAQCIRLAANVLMPPEAFSDFVGNQTRFSDDPAENCERLTPVARNFGVSNWAAAIQMRRLGKMNEAAFNGLKKYWESALQNFRNTQNVKFRGGSRQISRETLRQFGRLYTGTVWQAFYDKEITLCKLCKFFSLSKVSYARKLEQLL